MTRGNKAGFLFYMISQIAHTAAIPVSSNWPSNPWAACIKSGDTRWKVALEELERSVRTLIHWVIQVLRDLWRSLVQSLAHSRANSKARWDLTGPCPVRIGQCSRMGISQLPWGPAAVLHHSHREEFLLIKKSDFFFLQHVSLASGPFSVHFWEESGSVFSITAL